jgi:hypothetical protein
MTEIKYDYLDLYKIENTINLDSHPCFSNSEIYPNFQDQLEEFKTLLINLVENNESKTFYKFGDGDYFFLKKQPIGSASPGKRALSKNYNEIDHDKFVEGSLLCDYYTCEIYPENRSHFREVIPHLEIDFPAEYGYGLVSNKWLLKTFAGKIGIIGADKKVKIIKNLMESSQYQSYLGIDQFEDYITIPQQFACDDLIKTEKMIAKQLKKSTSKIFLVGIGHVKSGLLHRLKKYTDAVFLDVGSSIDALAGIIDINRPFFGDWTNYQIDDQKLYTDIDYLQYNREGKHVLLQKE